MRLSTPGSSPNHGFWPAAGAPLTVTYCTGDCNADNAVTVDEVIRGVNIALGNVGIGDCLPLDRNGDVAVTIDELVAAVANALSGCAV